MDKLLGLGVALVTPFKADKSVDFDGLQKLVEHQISGGTNYLVVQGTTGESATLTASEKQEILDFVIKVNDGRLPIVFGLGGNNTLAMIDQYKSFDLSKVDAILSASPYYNKPSQEGIYQHYKYLAENITHPIILYNVPGRTSSNMQPATTLRLAKDFSNIVAIKEASGDLAQVMKIIKDKPSDFLVLSGDDPLTLPMISVGADGLISVVANAYPKETSLLVNEALKGNYEQSKKYHYLLLELIDYLFADGNPGGIKETLKAIKICDNYVRLPLVPVNDGVASNIKRIVGEIS